jgi:hypothetical protein
MIAVWRNCQQKKNESKRGRIEMGEIGRFTRPALGKRQLRSRRHPLGPLFIYFRFVDELLLCRARQTAHSYRRSHHCQEQTGCAEKQERERERQ